MKQLLLNLLWFTSAGASFNVTKCRCRSYESCWPSSQEWGTLNTSIQGNLVAVRPVATVCHGQYTDSSACKEVKEQWTNSTWRAAQPGAVQWEDWEAWPEHNQSCYIESPQGIPCGQGRISLYSALVKSASQIQSTVRFAMQHNLRLVIKNSGHDFLGRSSSPESLQILTNGMKGVQFDNSFVPKGALGNRSEGHGVTIAAGVSLQELYEAVGTQNRSVIAGSSHTVGAAGGYIQGGGHSPFGTWKGMASDNALEFQVVIANGDLVYANAYQNTDLFWALRGGGGGTFGVVVSVTVRTFPEVPVVVTNLNISTSIGDPHFWTALAEFHAALPTLNGAGGSGYYFALPDYPLNQNTSVSAMTLMLLFPNNTDTARIDRLYAPLLSTLNGTSGVMTQYASFVFSSIKDVFSNLLIPGDADETGGIDVTASRLYSRDLLVSKQGPSKLIAALRSLKFDPGQPFIGHVVAGGAVATNSRTVDSALSPAWRKTIVHIAFGRSWDANATLEEQQAVKDYVTNIDVPTLQSVEGADRMGAYLNEANPYETDFQRSFWGENYQRLYQIKKKIGPDRVVHCSQKRWK